MLLGLIPTGLLHLVLAVFVEQPGLGQTSVPILLKLYSCIECSEKFTKLIYFGRVNIVKCTVYMVGCAWQSPQVPESMVLCRVEFKCQDVYGSGYKYQSPWYYVEQSLNGRMYMVESTSPRVHGIMQGSSCLAWLFSHLCPSQQRQSPETHLPPTLTGRGHTTILQENKMTKVTGIIQQ